MQGLQIAPAGKAAVSAGVATGIAGAGNAGAGDVTEDAFGSAFGAILAFQIKGQAVAAKCGVEVALQEKTDADKGKIDSLATDGAVADGVLSDLLALVNAGAVPIQITPVPLAPATIPQDAAMQRGADPLAPVVGGAVGTIAGQMTGLAGVAEMAGKLADVSDVAAKPDQFAGLLADKAANATGSPVVEGFAANGKMLPIVEPVAKQSVAEKVEPLASQLAGKTADAGSAIMERVDGGGKMPPVAEPSLGKTLLEAFMQTKPAPATAKLEAAGAGANDLSALLAMPQTAAMAGNQATIAPASPIEIAVPVSSPNWGNALAEKVTWMSGQGNQVAELHLNPPHLGPLEVQLTVINDQASAVFVSHHPAVRDAIEAAMPRLREMLADNGIMLGNTMVGAESFQQQQQQAFAKNSGGGGGKGEVKDDSANIGVPVHADGGVVRTGNGMVDTFV